ncbi:MAG: hypothetical protein AAGC55_00660 [Myxococcota bacterium]
MNRTAGKSPEEEAELLRLVQAIGAGSDPAFERLWRRIEPAVDNAVRSRRLLQKLAERPHERADCKQAIALKLRRVVPTYNEYSATHDGRSAPPLSSWLGAVICNAAIDFRRKHPEYRRGNAGDNAGGNVDGERQRRWRVFVDATYLDEVAEAGGAGLGRVSADRVRDEQTGALARTVQVRQMLQWARDNLPAEQLNGLRRWLYAEDARQSKEARAALRKLRDRFRGVEP